METQFDLRELLEAIIGSEAKRRLRLRRKDNDHLFRTYFDHLVLRHRSPDGLDEARLVLSHFRTFLSGSSPTPELADSFLAGYADRKPNTLYCYHSIVRTLMHWCGDEMESRVRVPQALPDYVETDNIERLKEAMRSKKSHESVMAGTCS